MSGHNKWSKIKRDKAITDSKKSKVFSKYSHQISVAAKEGGGDPDANPTLRMLIDKARADAMPKDNIQKAIDKGTGAGSELMNLESTVYEGYGPSGVAFLVKALTDNKNRTVSEIRNIFTSYGGSLGASGSAAYIFSDDGSASFTVPVDQDTLEKLQEFEEKLSDHDDVQEVLSNYQS